MAPIKVWELAGADPQRVFSPFCWASRLAVLHKGLEYESVPWCAPGRAGAPCLLLLPVRRSYCLWWAGVHAQCF